MAYDSANRKLYTTASEGISTSEVAACLGDYRVTARGREIGLLCTSPKINKWAKCKPIRSNERRKLLDSDRKAVNYGIEFPSLSWLTIFGVQESERILRYNAPRGNGVTPIEPFRLLDFDGYNHKAQGIEVYLNVDAKIVAGSGFDVALTVYNAEELSLSDFSMPYTTMSSTLKKPLSEFYVMLLMKIGDTYAVYNTRKTLANMNGLPLLFKVSQQDYNFKVGQEVSVIVCLAYDANMPEGFQTLSTTYGSYNYVYFIPLNITEDLEAEEHRIVTEFMYFSQFGITNGTVSPPRSGANYYSISGYYVIQCRDPYKTNPLLRMVYYIKRGTQIIVPTNGSNIREYTLSLTESPAGSGNYIYDLGPQSISPIGSTETGDEFRVEVRVIDGANEVKVYDKLLYVH